MTGEFKINVYFDERGKELENLISEILTSTLTKKLFLEHSIVEKCEI